MVSSLTPKGIAKNVLQVFSAELLWSLFIKACSGTVMGPELQESDALWL